MLKEALVPRLSQSSDIRFAVYGNGNSSSHDLDSEIGSLPNIMDESELAHTVAGLSNEILALLVAHLGQASSMSQGELYRELYRGYPNRKIDQLSTYYTYLTHLENFGYVQRERGENSRVAVSLTEYGREQGVASAGFLLDFSRRFAPNLNDISEDGYPVDHRLRVLKTPHGEISTQTYGSALRIDIIRKFAATIQSRSLGRDFLHPEIVILPYQIKELAEELGVPESMIRSDLASMSASGIIGYQYHARDEASAAFALPHSGLLFSETPAPQEENKQSIFRDLIWQYAINHGYEDLTRDGGLAYMIDNFYGEEIYQRNIIEIKNRVGKELRKLTSEGKLVQIGINGATGHGVLRLSRKHRRLIGNIGATLTDIESREPHKLAEGKRHAERITRDRLWKEQLLDKARAGFDQKDYAGSSMGS